MLDKLSPILGHVLDQCLRQVERVDGRFLVELTGLFEIFFGFFKLIKTNLLGIGNVHADLLHAILAD